jgi:hypothetical protein
MMNLRRVAAEFTLIVAGVLTALAFDASWDQHTDRVREREYYQRLLADITVNQQRLHEAVRVESDQLQRAGAILSALRSDRQFDVDSAASWLNREPVFPWYSDPRLRDGTLTALIATGDINIIRNESVRAATIGYNSQLRADLAEFTRSIEPFQLLAQRHYKLTEGRRTTAVEQDLTEDARALTTLRHDPEATLVFRLFRVNIETRIWYLAQMLAATDSFAAVLKAHPGGRTL